MMRKPNYDKFPVTRVEGDLWKGWDSIVDQIKKRAASQQTYLVVMDHYTGVHEEEIAQAIALCGASEVVWTGDLLKSEDEIRQMTDRYMTDDAIFGYLSPLSLVEFFDQQRVEKARQKVQQNQGLTIVWGVGAHMVAPQSDLFIYADMARWEIQMRFRRKEVRALGVDNRSESPAWQYKRGLFNDWRVLDAYKRSFYPQVDLWIDTHVVGEPKMITGATFLEGIRRTAYRPFRVVPFFDPAPWGGQWMKSVCDLDPSKENYGWCFDCVPEENSLLLQVEGELFEMPSINLVFLHSRQLLGEPVEARFGKEFPIRFDFLDTVDGGNLSLQVHPTTQFIREEFGMFYTQDESYYLLDAEEGATVYLGLKEGIDSQAMIDDLRAAQRGEIVFDADKYANCLPAKKHDHFLIPGGTVHCSGSGALVLEISSTPNLFTFKLWDWERLGLDGKPRPINVERGKEVIDWGRDTAYVHQHLANVIRPIAEGDGWREEATGLHPNEFIETRRHWFTKTTPHSTHNSVNVFNLVQGEEAIVESPTGAFEPFIVHYAETFIIPAGVGEYTIRPYGLAEGTECATMKAYVRV